MPAFNTIYGDGFSAPGFLSAVFNFLLYSGEKYPCPDGWRRIRLNIADTPEEFDRRYSGWHVAYHGIHHELIASILSNGLIANKGYRSDEEKVIYFTPSI